MAILRAGSRDQAPSPLAGPDAETLYGRLVELHLDGTGRLIPEDRSYFYGYLIRWLALFPHSFTPLLVIQALASGATAIVFALICRGFFLNCRTLSGFCSGSFARWIPCSLSGNDM